MHKIVRFFYLVNNLFWSFLVLIAVPKTLMSGVTALNMFNLSIVFIIALIQIVGGYFLYRGKITLAIIASLLLAINIDFSSIKLVYGILLEVGFVFKESTFEILFNLNLPSFRANFSTDDVSFNSVGLNLVLVLQIILMILMYRRKRKIIPPTPSPSM